MSKKAKTVKASLGVVVARRTSDLPAVTRLNEQHTNAARAGLPLPVSRRKSLWTPGTAKELRVDDCTGLVIDIKKLDPSVRYLYVYIVPT